MSPIDPIAVKAAGVVADTGRDGAKGFISAVLRAPGEAFGGLLADFVNERRHANLIKIAGRAQERLSAAGVAPREVPLAIIHPALEAASLQEDPDLQETWANLLANAADPRAQDSILPSFPEILRQLTPREVKFLDALYQMVLDRSKRPNGNDVDVNTVTFEHHEVHRIYNNAGLSRVNASGFSHEETVKFKEEIIADRRDAEICMDTVQRHELVIESADLNGEEKFIEGTAGPIRYRIPRDRYWLNCDYSFSCFGVAFVNACRPPKISE